MDALDSGSLVPREDKVFRPDHLVYFFYGRPSYRVHMDEHPSGLSHYLPVCIIFRPTGLPTPKRVFPFDTGAFHAGLYSNAMHQDMSIADFGLDPDLTSAGKLVSLFFESAKDYLEAKPRTSVPIASTDFEAHSFHALIAQQTRSNADDRVSAVELQFDCPISLASHAQAIVAPGPLLDSPIVKASLARMTIEPLPYEQLGRHRPSDHVAGLFQICFEYYRRSGIL